MVKNTDIDKETISLPTTGSSRISNLKTKQDISLQKQVNNNNKNRSPQKNVNGTSSSSSSSSAPLANGNHPLTLACPRNCIKVNHKDIKFEHTEVEFLIPKLISGSVQHSVQVRSIEILFKSSDDEFYRQACSNGSLKVNGNGTLAENQDPNVEKPLFKFVLELWDDVRPEETIVVSDLNDENSFKLKLTKKTPKKWSQLERMKPNDMIMCLDYSSNPTINKSPKSKTNLLLSKSPEKSVSVIVAKPPLSPTVVSNSVPSSNNNNQSDKSPSKLLTPIGTPVKNDHDDDDDLSKKDKLADNCSSGHNTPTQHPSPPKDTENEHNSLHLNDRSLPDVISCTITTAPIEINRPLSPVLFFMSPTKCDKIEEAPEDEIYNPDSPHHSPPPSSSFKSLSDDYPSLFKRSGFNDFNSSPEEKKIIPILPFPSFSAATNDNGSNIEKSVRQIQIVHRYRYGHTGLSNLGNTCFMNSTLQCLSNTELLRDYFLCGQYKKHLNQENPFGSHGRIASEFANLLQNLWSGESLCFSPRSLKMAIGQKCSQFADYAQHDAVEFMEHFLDVLHEDLNTVDRTKLVDVEPIENEDQLEDEQLSEEQWKRFRRRNSSIITDIFYGQYKSKLTCPTCNKVSITFDPFSYMAIPMSKAQIEHRLYFFALGASQPELIRVKLPQLARTFDLIKVISQKTAVEFMRLDVYEYLAKRKVGKQLGRQEIVSNVRKDTRLFVFEKPDRLHKTFFVQQRLKHSIPPRVRRPITAKCHTCNLSFHNKRNSEPITCNRCRSAYFCNQECLRVSQNDRMRHDCIPEQAYVGWPFMLSVTDEQLTSCDQFMNLLKQRACMSVDLEESKQSKLVESIHAAKEIKEGDFHVDHDMEPSGEDLAESGLSDQLVEEEKGEDKEVIDNREALAEDGILVKKNEAEPEPVLNLFGFQLIGIEMKGTSECDKLIEYRPDAEPDYLKRQLEDVYFLNIEWETSTAGDEAADEDQMEVDNTADHESSSVFSPTIVKTTVKVENKPETKSIFEKMFERERDYSYGDQEQSQYTLEDSILKFTEPETLSMQEAWHCPTCKEPREASKQLTIWRPPPILIIQLKRFSYNSMVREKINSFVKFPVQGLDISRFCSHPAYQNGDGDHQKPIYDLYGVIDHYGNLYCGHYTASANSNFDGSNLGWRQFDDSHVSDVDPKVSQSAYVLFYKLRTNSDDKNDSHSGDSN